MVEYLKPAAIIGIPSIIAGIANAVYQTVDFPPAIFYKQDPFSRMRNTMELTRFCWNMIPGIEPPLFCHIVSPSILAINFGEAALATGLVVWGIKTTINFFRNRNKPVPNIEHSSDQSPDQVLDTQ